MKFYWRFFCCRAAVVSRFYSLAKYLIVFSVLLVTTWKQTTPLVITHLRGSLALTRVHVIVLRWELGEVTLESLTSLRVLVHGDWCLHTTVRESSTIDVLLPENVIMLILLILHLSMSINVFLWLLREVTSSNSKAALPPRWCVYLHRCVTFWRARVGTLRKLLLLLLTELIPLLGTCSIASWSSTKNAVHTEMILLRHDLFAVSHRIHFLLLRHEAIHRVCWFLLLELLLIFADLILILHLVVLLLWT